MTDFETACKEACAFVREHRACDLRCMDGRGRCSIFLVHMTGFDGMTRDEVLEKWKEKKNADQR